MTNAAPTDLRGIETKDVDAVRVVTIANESKRNAFDSAMTVELERALLEADANPAVRAIVVTGAGTESFSSGHDLMEVMEHPELAGDPVANAAFTTPPRLGTPVIGAVNGNAYAAGFILALNCDLRVAGRNARFCAVGAKIGLVPVGGQLSRLLQVMTYPSAFKMIATGLPMDAEEALACQFVTAVCDPAETVDQAIALGHQIAAASPAVIRAAKTGLRATLSHGLDVGLLLEPSIAAVVRELPDGAEGVAAFLEKRQAAYPDSPRDLQDSLDAAVSAGTSRRA
jgi:enoyl-CoA hydratase/carnithine racemase